MSSGTFTNNGTYTGSGTVNGGTFENAGTVAPTNCMTFGNDFVNTGTLQINLGGTTTCTDFSKITITGAATLGGTLQVTATNAYTGAVGHQAQIVTANSVSSSFSTQILPNSWQTDYNASNVTLTYQVALPVELISLKGKVESNYNLLSWITASERNSKGFTVERKANQQWVKVGFVPAQGVGSLYTFRDIPPPSTIHYYRLKIEDLDEKFNYSNVISIVSMEQTPQMVKAYPNPTSHTLHIETTEKENYMLFNHLGQVVMSGQLTPQIDVSGLPAGSYILKIGSSITKIVVQ
jgi:hypothetical protein